jgi:hypothetical protein
VTKIIKQKSIYNNIQQDRDLHVRREILCDPTFNVENFLRNPKNEFPDLISLMEDDPVMVMITETSPGLITKRKILGFVVGTGILNGVRQYTIKVLDANKIKIPIPIQERV